MITEEYMRRSEKLVAQTGGSHPSPSDDGTDSFCGTPQSNTLSVASSFGKSQGKPYSLKIEHDESEGYWKITRG